MELDLHAAVLVGVDLLAGGPDDDRRLDAVDLRAAGDARGAQHDRRRDDLEAVRVRGKSRVVVAATAGRVVGLGAPVLDARHEVLGVERVVRVVGERERRTRVEARADALAASDGAPRLLLVEADLGDGPAVARDRVPAGVVVGLEVLVLRALGELREVERGLLEVPVAERRLAAADLLGDVEHQHVVAGLAAADRARLGAEDEARVAGDRREGGHLVDERELLALAALVEVVEDALVLEQPADEVPVRLAVLHAVLARDVGALQAQGEVAAGGVAGALEHLLHDLGRRQVLEDPRVVAVLEQPRPRDDRQAVLDPLLERLGLLEARDEAVHDVVVRLVDGPHHELRLLAHDVGRRDGGLGRDGHLELEELRDTLGALEVEDAYVVAEAVDVERVQCAVGHGRADLGSVSVQ